MANRNVTVALQSALGEMAVLTPDGECQEIILAAHMNSLKNLINDWKRCRFIGPTQMEPK